MKINDRTVPYIWYNHEIRGYELDIINSRRAREYYAQIQINMLLTKSKLAYFMIYTVEDQLDFKIRYNDEYTKDLLKKLREYYFKGGILASHC